MLPGMIFDEWPLNLIIKTLMPGSLSGPPGIVYISGGAIQHIYLFGDSTVCLFEFLSKYFVICHMFFRLKPYSVKVLADQEIQ